MRYVHKLFSGRHADRPAAVLTVALGLAFACADTPTGSESGTLEQALFKGKPAGNGPSNCDAYTPLSITFRDDPGDALRSDNGTPYVEGAGDGGVHLNGPTGRLKLHTASGVNGRVVNVITTLFNGSTTDRIYTNGHETEDDQKDNGCGFLQMPTPSTGDAVLEVELDGEGIVRWGKDCDGKPDEGTRVTTTRSGDGNTWTIEGFSEERSGVHCKNVSKKKGKVSLTPVGTAGAFEITLVKILE